MTVVADSAPAQSKGGAYPHPRDLERFAGFIRSERAK